MTKEEKPAAWRCACGKQMLNGEKAKVEKDKDGRTILICDRHPKCGNEPMARSEWNRYRHMAAVCGEDFAEKWRKETLPVIREREAQRIKMLERLQKEAEQRKESRAKRR